MAAVRVGKKGNGEREREYAGMHVGAQGDERKGTKGGKAVDEEDEKEREGA